MNTFSLGIDLYQSLNNVVPQVTQYDTGVTFNLNIYENGGVFNLNGHTINVSVVKPSGAVVSKQASITNATYGMATITLPNQATTEVGECSIVFDLNNTSNTQKKCIYQCKMKVVDYPIGDADVESLSDFPILQQKIVEVQNAINEVNTHNAVFIRYREVN